MDTVRYETADAFTRHVEQLRTSGMASQRRVLVCCGTGCLAGGAKDVAGAMEKQLASLPADKRAELNLVMKKTGCHGFCEKGPLVVLMPQGTFYKGVKVKDVDAIVQKSILGGEVIESLLYVEPKTGERVEKYGDIEYFLGTTVLARPAEAVGFHAVDLPPGIGRWWARLYRYWLILVYHPEGGRRLSGHRSEKLEVRLAYITREGLMERYGGGTHA